MRSLRATNPKPRHDRSRIAQFQRNADSIDRTVQPFNLSLLRLLPRSLIWTRFVGRSGNNYEMQVLRLPEELRSGRHPRSGRAESSKALVGCRQAFLDEDSALSSIPMRSFTAERNAVYSRGIARLSEWNPRGELAGIERFWQVIVSLHLQTWEPIEVVTSWRKQQDRRIGFRSDSPEHFKAIDLWKHHIQNDQIISSSLDRLADLGDVPLKMAK